MAARARAEREPRVGRGLQGVAQPEQGSSWKAGRLEWPAAQRFSRREKWLVQAEAAGAPTESVPAGVLAARVWRESRYLDVPPAWQE